MMGMFRSIKRWKPWVRWTTGAVLAVLLLAGAGVGWAWYRIQSTDLSAIQARHKGASTAPGPDPIVPGALQDPLLKAEQLTNKKISPQDALDVASILVKAGLSMKEISYLTDSTKTDLPVAEKQRIRDLLLSKLSKEEIATLRSITKPYGKDLVILDPTYPIELVGVYDPGERAKIIAQIRAKRENPGQAASAPNTSGGETGGQTSPGSGGNDSTATGNSSGSSGGSGTSDAGAAGSAGSGNTGSTVGHSGSAASSGGSGDSAAKAALRSRYESRLQAVKAACRSKVNAIVDSIGQSISAAKAAGKSVSIQQLQQTYMGRIMAAEGECDSSFNEIYGEAKSAYNAAGYDSSELDVWQSEYDSAKNAARAAALSRLSKFVAS
jgi:hypothetical protein